MVFGTDIREEIERLLRNAAILRRHNENLQALIHDLPQIVDYLTFGLRLDDATAEFYAEVEESKPFLNKLTYLLDEHISALYWECEKLEELLNKTTKPLQLWEHENNT